MNHFLEIQRKTIIELPRLLPFPAGFIVVQGEELCKLAFLKGRRRTDQAGKKSVFVFIVLARITQIQ